MEPPLEEEPRHQAGKYLCTAHPIGSSGEKVIETEEKGREGGGREGEGKGKGRKGKAVTLGTFCWSRSSFESGF